MQEAERTLNYGCKLKGIHETKLYDMWLERDRTKQTVRTLGEFSGLGEFRRELKYTEIFVKGRWVCDLA